MQFSDLIQEEGRDEVFARFLGDAVYAGRRARRRLVVLLVERQGFDVANAQDAVDFAFGDEA